MKSERESPEGLSHLGFVALGIIAKKGPYTGYQLMQEFRLSNSSYFSGSAGAIYPLLKRLEEREFVKKVPQTKKKTEYVISEEGRSLLLEWLGPAISSEEVSYSIDFVRSRMYFLGLLPRGDAVSMLEEASRRIQENLSRNREFELAYIAEEDVFGELAAHNLVLTDEARLRWLETAIARLQIG